VSPYRRAAYGIGACLLPLLLVLRASAGELTEIEQITGNHGVITQTGTANAATLEQRAILGQFGANIATLTQEGAGNSAGVTQKGTRNEATLGQFGDNNSAQLGQYGIGLKSDVTQSGNGLGVTVNQFGIGGGPVVIRQH
jgi:minor curlin subunit